MLTALKNLELSWDQKDMGLSPKKIQNANTSTFQLIIKQHKKQNFLLTVFVYYQLRNIASKAWNTSQPISQQGGTLQGDHLHHALLRVLYYCIGIDGYGLLRTMPRNRLTSSEGRQSDTVWRNELHPLHLSYLSPPLKLPCAPCRHENVRPTLARVFTLHSRWCHAHHHVRFVFTIPVPPSWLPWL